MSDDFETPYNDWEEHETVDGGQEEDGRTNNFLYFQIKNGTPLGGCKWVYIPFIALHFFVSMMLVMENEPQTPLETFGIFSLNFKRISKRLRWMVVFSAGLN